MPHLRSVHALVIAALLVLATGCSAAAPRYSLQGDACGVVPVGPFQDLAGGPPSTRTPGGLGKGLDGGYCTMEFDGDAGYVKLDTFIALHPTGVDAAKAMYTQFRDHDLGHVNDGAAVADVPDLGSAAYLERRRLSGDSGAWKPTDDSLYRYAVQDGNLVLTVTFDGYGVPGSAWPTSEQQLQDDVRSAVKQILATLAR